MLSLRVLWLGLLLMTAATTVVVAEVELDPALTRTPEVRTCDPESTLGNPRQQSLATRAQYVAAVVKPELALTRTAQTLQEWSYVRRGNTGAIVRIQWEYLHKPVHYSPNHSRWLHAAKDTDQPAEKAANEGFVSTALLMDDAASISSTSTYSTGSYPHRRRFLARMLRPFRRLR